MLKRYKIKNYNFRLILLLITLSVIGVLLVGSAEQAYQTKQAVGVAGGVLLMVIVSLVDYSWILNFSWLLYLLNLGLLGILYTGFAKTTGGASRWIQVTDSFQFQPTELSKILLILFFAAFFMRHEDNVNRPRTIFASIALLVPPIVLIYRQPDLKNTITVLVIFCLVIYAAGLSYKVIGGILLAVLPLILGVLIFVAQVDVRTFPFPESMEFIQYQLGRIDTWMNPEDEDNREDSIQQENSVTAIGSGQLTGKGLNNNLVSSANKGNFVSQIHNDFIFAVAGEELGFLGCCFIIFLLFAIVLECIRTARRAKDLAGTLICSGMAALIAFQSFLNISVATGILPNTGTPLPFVSYGLTSLFTLYIGMGFVLNVGLQNRDFVTRNEELRRRKVIYEHRTDRA